MATKRPSVMRCVHVYRPLPTLTVAAFSIGDDSYHVKHHAGTNTVQWSHDTDTKRKYTVWCRPATLEPIACDCPAHAKCKHMRATAALSSLLLGDA